MYVFNTYDVLLDILPR